MLATANRHKLGEFQKILALFEVLPMPAWVELPPEDVESFAYNARGKALGLARALAAGGPAAAVWTDDARDTRPISDMEVLLVFGTHCQSRLLVERSTAGPFH